ncbi:MAG: Hpt domain-containing protein, partial [Campylobacteraceae bacterium]|nr:Hpt domain-containing protein [Campylobacteraceae bacterium]
MAGFDISKYREMFVEEAEELFESADHLLLEAENNETLSDEQMGQLFRDVHTLKGSGASVELALFAEFTHDVENLMDKLRNHDIEFIPEMVETLIDGLDVMKELLELEVSEELTRETFTEMTVDLLVDLRAYVNGETVVSPKTVQKETPTVEVKSAISTEKQAFNNFNQISTDSTSDSFGFYDEELEKKKNDSPYGFFADDDDIMQNDDSEAFGFFDEELQKAAKIAPDVPLREYEENDDFGFFDDMPDITPETTADQPIT